MAKIGQKKVKNENHPKYDFRYSLEILLCQKLSMHKNKGDTQKTKFTKEIEEKTLQNLKQAIKWQTILENNTQNSQTKSGYILIIITCLLKSNPFEPVKCTKMDFFLIYEKNRKRNAPKIISNISI